MTSYPLAVNKIRTEKLIFPKTGGKFGEKVRGSKAHWGWDLVAPPGTSVYAVGPGEITNVAKKVPGYGDIIQLKFTHKNNSYWALYAHLSIIWVTKGQRIREGEIIGQTGNTGNAGGQPPHLHFEIATSPSLKKGRHNQINPASVLGDFLDENEAGGATVTYPARETDWEVLARQLWTA